MELKSSGIKTAAHGMLVCGSLVASLLLLDTVSLRQELVLLGAALVLSLAVAGSLNPWAATAAGLAVFTHALISPVSVPLASMLLFGWVFAPRSLRARTFARGSLIVALAAVGGAAAGFLVPLYLGTPVMFVAVGIGALLILSALLPGVDDRIATRLRFLAARSRGKTRQLLLRAYAIRSRDRLPKPWSSHTRRIEHAWRELELDAAQRQLVLPIDDN